MLIRTSPLHLVTATRFACYCDHYPMTFVWWSGGAMSTHICMLQGWGWNGTYPCSFSHTHDKRLDWQQELYQKGSQINNPSATGDRKRRTYMVHAPYSFVSPNARFTRVDCLLEPVRMSVKLEQIIILGQRHTTVFQALFVSLRGDMLSYPSLERP